MTLRGRLMRISKIFRKGSCSQGSRRESSLYCLNTGRLLIKLLSAFLTCSFQDMPIRGRYSLSALSRGFIILFMQDMLIFPGVPSYMEAGAQAQPGLQSVFYHSLK